MWMKAAGAIMVISGSGMLGMISARSLERRVEQIRQIRMALGVLEKEITYLHIPLAQAMAECARQIPPPVKNIFSQCSQSLKDKQGITFSDAWADSLRKAKPQCNLTSAEWDLLASLSFQLGMSGPEEQKKLFMLTQEQLKVLEERARQEVQSGKKIRAYGGFIAGAAIVLILL